jgi:vacuolar-type H+-ATPase subunit I/STV1
LLNEIYNVAKESGNEIARLDGVLTKVYNSSMFLDSKGKEKALEQYQEILIEKNQAIEQVDEVIRYLNKLIKDINQFKPGIFGSRIHNKRIKRLKKDIKEEVEIIKPEIKLLEYIEKDIIVIDPETKEQIAKDIKSIKSEKETNKEIKSIKESMQIRKIKVNSLFKDSKKFEI